MVRRTISAVPVAIPKENEPMRLKTLAIAAVLGGLGLSFAVAQEDPQAVRQAQMKAVGQSMGALGAITKGEKPYDRSEERRVGKECVRTYRSRWSLYP